MKDLFNRQLIEQTAAHIKSQFADFNQDGFIQLASDNLEGRELKDRANQIYLGLKHYLPDDFLTSIDILVNTLQPQIDNQDLTEVTTDERGVAGWMIMPYSQYVGVLGQSHLSEAMSALQTMTKLFTSEFGIRYLLLAHPERCLQIMQPWCTDSCHHVRRLVSEGTRPLLPWAMQLEQFKQNPSPVLPLLNKLKSDDSEYVRRSVANHLNDISKNQPDLIANIAKEWMVEADTNRYRLVKHACRTLIKKGHPETLAVFGYSELTKVSVSLTVSPEVINMGETLTLEVDLTNHNHHQVAILMDYVVYHKKANGKLAPKVFKFKTLLLGARESITLLKKHTIKPISTRKYYSGAHQCALLLNGKEFAAADFNLQIEHQ